jgi:hypothetical protein
MEPKRYTTLLKFFRSNAFDIDKTIIKANIIEGIPHKPGRPSCPGAYYYSPLKNP